MKASTKIFLSCILVLMSAVIVAIFFSSASNASIIIYNPVTNQSTQQRVKKGQSLKNLIEADNTDKYEFYDFYSNDFESRLGIDYKISKNYETIVLGFVKTVDDLSQLSNNVVGIKYIGNLTDADIENLFNQNYFFLDLSLATTSGQYPSNNTSLQELKLPQGIVCGANNLSALKSVECKANCQLSNAFNNCLNLKSVNLQSCTTIYNSFNKCPNLRSFEICESMNKIDESFIETNLEEVANKSNNFMLENDVLYQKDQQSLVAKKALSTVVDIQLNSQTTKIDKYAFYKHSSVNNVVLNAKTSVIGENAFSCSSIKSINIPQETVLAIENSAFSDCLKLKNIQLGKGVKSIGDFAFSNTDVEEFSVDEDCVLSNIGKYAFANNTNLKSVKLLETSLVVGEGAFSNCINLATFKNLNTENIPSKMFENCSSLQQIINFSKVENVGNYAFSNCRSLEDISQLYNAKEVGTATFANCQSIKKAEFVSLSKVTPNLFLNCSSLLRFATAGNLVEFDSMAFDGCENISNLSFFGNFIVEDGAVYDSAKTKVLYYLPKQTNAIFEVKSTVEELDIRSISKNPYIASFSSQSDKFLAVDGVLFSADGQTLIAYPNAKAGEKYTVPEQAKEISAYAFSNTQNLKELEIGSQIRTLNCGFLWQNFSVQTLKVPFIGKTSLDLDTCFLGWFFGAPNFAQNGGYVSKSLKNIEVFEQSEFANNCFYDCEDLLTVSLLKCGKVTSMMFYCCYNLQYINLATELTWIDDYAFYDCQNLLGLNVVYSSNLTKDDVKLSAFERTPDGVKVTVLCEGLTSEQWVKYKECFRNIQYKWNWSIKITK